MVFAERALLEAEQAEARLKGGDERPLLGVPIAIKDDDRPRRRADHARHRRLPRAGQGRLGDGAAAARGGGDRGRPDAAAGAGDLRLHRVGDLRRHPQPLEPAAHSRRLERRQRRGGRRRPGPDRLGLRRRRLDPHPRRLLRPLRAEAAARPGLAGPRPRALERALGQRLRQPHACSTRRSGSTSSRGGSEEPEAPPPPERPFVESAKTPPGKLRVAWSTARAARGGAADRLRRSPRGRSPRPPSCCARSGTRSAQRDPDWGMIGNNIAPRFLRGVAEDCRRGARTPSASNAAPAASAGSAACSPTGLYEQARRGSRRRRRPGQRDLRHPRRADDPGDGRHGAAGAPLGGPRRALRPCSG